MAERVQGPRRPGCERLIGARKLQNGTVSLRCARLSRGAPMIVFGNGRLHRRGVDGMMWWRAGILVVWRETPFAMLPNGT
jgi:hypothetical protein